MDTISEFITRVRNAGLAKHEKVDIPSSNVRVGIATVLRDTGYIRSFKVVKDGKQGMMRIYLKYTEDGRHAVEAIDRKSRPGRRFYVQCQQIPSVRSGFGISVLSTSSGIMGGREATEKKLGGELLFTVW
jgi:small subunit ribosomal protein S8